MSLERLANELLFDVFEYLSCVDLFHAFNELNCRFNSLLIEYFRHQTYFDFRFIFKEDLSMIRRRYLPLFINEIKSICLSDDDQTPHEIDIFISRLYPLHRFQNLQSISLFNIYSIEKINRILDDLQQIPYLINLNLKQCYIKYDPKNILIMMNNIWSLVNLMDCCLDVYFEDVCHLIPPNIISCSIKHLSLSSFQCDLDNLSLLHEHTPYIESLSVNIWDPYDTHCQLSLVPSLTTLKIKCESSSRIIQALLRKIPNLINLTVQTKKVPMDGHMWKEILNKYLLKLKLFNLKMEFETNGNDNIEQEMDRIIDSYRDHFWIDQHKWFVRCFSYAENDNSLIYLHTLPYVFEYFTMNINENFLFKSTCPTDNHYLTYNYVENLNYCCTTLEGINFSKIQFCNLQHLTLTFPYDDNFRCIVSQFKNLTYLEIIMVNLSQYDNDLQQLQIIFDQAPNLYRLKFHSWLSIPSKFENKNKKTSNQTVWTMPPFSSRSSSVRYLDLRGINQSGQSHYYNDQHCLSLIRSPLGSQCEFLRIEVEKRTNIIDLVNRMNHLRTLNVLCRDRKRNDDLVKWLQARLPSTCSFAKDSTSPNDIRLWIR
ncbi:unnamed protein product [Rotaria magnacalcarata]|uniref:F-box domain-containing protein n=2 Tax=Rotaria magnacalcarata TaxID=392030 RepID=A0A819TJN8_9BILA|nr:unnamed protein product [Rotaria magnacalcarata]CAF2161749.1 unnamed protein product [Rotaria magnacalcarata]CAF4003129.1 unnamed protein product [Rotaria magnacalcarata]CAF4079437.1 unnamed protein product [Rotaria magnacalcarata]